MSQRNVRSDPEAVKQVARATNNLLDSLGSLAVEVRNTPTHITPDDVICVRTPDRHILQWTYVPCGGQLVLQLAEVSICGQMCPPAYISSSLRPLGLFGSVSESLCVQMKGVFLQQRQTSSQLNKDSNISAGFTSHKAGQTTNSPLICVLLRVLLTLHTAGSSSLPLAVLSEAQTLWDSLSV